MLRKVASQTKEQNGTSVLTAVDYMDDGTPISLKVCLLALSPLLFYVAPGSHARKKQGAKKNVSSSASDDSCELLGHVPGIISLLKGWKKTNFS